MKKFLVGLLLGAMMLFSTAFAGPVEKDLYQRGYGSVVYDIMVDHEVPCACGDPAHTKIVTTYGEGLAIGPHYILTAFHVVDNGIWMNTGEYVDTTVKEIEVVSKDTRFGRSIMLKATVVETGKTDNREDDWAIIKTKKSLDNWMAPNISTVEAGDEVYNVCGNQLLFAGVYPMTIVAVDPYYLSVEIEGYEVKKIKPQRLLVYVATPRAKGGDSGSPVFNENGDLIGILVAGDERSTLLVKAERFRTEYDKYKTR